MRPAVRLLAAVRGARYLTPGQPTGLTGLLTHPHPRPQLMHVYKTTLEKLQQIPESSVYRQSVEAITNQRLQIVAAQTPAEETVTVEKQDGTRNKMVVEGPLTAEQIAEIETKIGAGLIEEVIQVAEGELELVDSMLEAKPWEELIEKPIEGQWTYFERGTGTEKPPA